VAQARELVGGHAALMGGIDTQSFVRSTPAQIVTEARRCVEGSGSRSFILGSGCVVPRTARPENLRAIVEWTRTYAP
jgi:uroporphyrinogen decarboxylase